MIIGKTSTTINKSEIFQLFSETQIACKVFGLSRIPCLINSPLRKDNSPSFSIYINSGGHVCYKDHAEKDTHGGLLDLLCKYWKCSFNQVFDNIMNVMGGEVKAESTHTTPKQIKMLTSKEAIEHTQIQVVVRPWKDYDYEYWGSYGITKKWLKYAEVYPISYKIVTKKATSKGTSEKYIFSADKYAYVFVERKENNLQFKIYQPFNTKGYKWCSKMDASVISLWTKIPEYGDTVIICSSLKDALCVSANLGIPAIAPQGEGYSLSNSAIKELKRRYKNIFICFDTDKPGIEDAKLLSESTGFPYIVPDLEKEKDLSDYYKSLSDKKQFNQLKSLFIN